MEITETPDFELLLTVLPYLQETDFTADNKFPVNTATLHLNHGAAARFGYYVEEDDFNGRFPIIGIPEIPSAIDSTRSIYDILMRCKLTKCYLVERESSIFIIIKSTPANGELTSYYAISIPATPTKVVAASKTKKLMLCRMKNFHFDPNEGEMNNIMLEVVKLKTREWESK